MATDSQSRKYILTINNPQQKNLSQEAINVIIEENLKSIIYYCMSDEVGGQEGTYHTHIFLQFSSPVRFSTLKNCFPDGSVHIDKSRGTAQENRDYVFKIGKWANSEKKETNLVETHFEWGELKEDKQGSRSDLTEIYEMIKEGYSSKEIIDIMPHHFTKIDQIGKTIQVIKHAENKGNFRDVFVIYIYGQTGTGKTSFVYNMFPKEDIFRVSDYKHPFDYYDSEPVLVLDEMRFELKMSLLLNLADRYPLVLPARYCSKMAAHRILIMLSNDKLTQMPMDTNKVSKSTWQAFLRRIHLVINFDDFAEKYSDINDRIDAVSEYVSCEYNNFLAKLEKSDENYNIELRKIQNK